jgi:hypothetical protein
MSEIHVYTTEGAQSVHPEAHVAELLRSGQLSPETLYWRQGMSGWRPLSTLSLSVPSHVPASRTGPLPENVSPPAQPARANSTTTGPSQKIAKLRPLHVRFRRDPEPLTTVLQVFLIACIGLTGFDLANALVHYNLISTQIPNLTDTPVPVLPQIMGPTELLFFQITEAVTLATLLPYLMWVYQANINSRSFSPIVRFSKGWAVWCNFVPLANLFIPCQVMQEIWKVSRNPRTWHNDRISLLVGTWWALWLLRVFGYTAYGVLSARAHTEGDVATAALVSLILLTVQLTYFGVFFAMITTIVKNQKRQVAAGRRRRAPEVASNPSTASTLS